MEKDTAADILSAIAKALNDYPHQFAVCLTPSGVGEVVTKGKADPAMVSAVQELSQYILGIVGELQEPAPERAYVHEWCGKILASQWAPEVLTTAVGAVLKAFFENDPY